MVTTLYLVRHCHAQGNLLEVFNGQTDGEITEMGKKQLDALTNACGGWNLSAIYASPLKRALATAEAVNKNYHLPIITDKRLMEINCGEWEGKSYHDIYRDYHDSYLMWDDHPESFASPGGETMQDAYDRITAVIHDLVRTHIGEAIAIVGHAAVFRCYLAYVRFGGLQSLNEIGWGDNTNISKITFNRQLKPTLCYQYDASHLPDDISTVQMRKRLGITRPHAQKE